MVYFRSPERDPFECLGLAKELFHEIGIRSFNGVPIRPRREQRQTPRNPMGTRLNEGSYSFAGP